MEIKYPLKCVTCADKINTLNGAYCRKMQLLTEYRQEAPCDKLPET